jgi:hypothetical protein
LFNVGHFLKVQNSVFCYIYLEESLALSRHSLNVCACTYMTLRKCIYLRVHTHAYFLWDRGRAPLPYTQWKTFLNLGLVHSFHDTSTTI